jgi:hypothetical protein
MRCCYCPREIKGQMEVAKRVEYREWPDGEERVYGENMPDGTLNQAQGRLIKAAHQKCYWAVWKRVNRGGDAVQGTRPGIIDPYAEDDDD